MADELRASALGCYGGSWGPTWTPSIDALAACGVLHERTFCNSPACVPSRISMLTAAAPERTGIYFNEGAWKSFPLPVRLPTFPEHFAAAGYAVASIGKSHHAQAYAPWQEDLAEGSGMHDFGLDADPVPLEPIVPDGIPSPVGGVFPADRPFPPEAVTRNAVAWLDAHAGAPFLLRVSYLQPHTPVLPPAVFRALQRAEDWPGHDLPRGYGSAFEEAFAEIVGGRRLSHAQMQRAQADYHALVTWLDVQVGLVLAKLDALALRDRTIVVLNADHGASLGENGLLGKVVFAPQSQRTPLIVAWPEALPAGARRDDLAQNLDLARTLCDLAGLEPLDSFEGRSLVSEPAPEAVFGVVGTGAPGATASAAAQAGLWRNGKGWPRRACVRTAQYRFDMNIRQDGASIEAAEEDWFLADSLADRDEQRNLAALPSHRGVAERLRARLLERASGALEPAFVPAFAADEAPEFLPPKINV